MSFNGTLKPFQQEAFDFMLEGDATLLSYEMGLGKTVVSIAWLEHLLDLEKVRGGLIIVPSSLKYQWGHSIKKFTTGAAYVIIDGDKSERESQLRMAQRAEYVIMSYDNIMQDDVWMKLSEIDIDFVVLDEATMIKNFRAKRTKRVKKIRPPFRLALTGTPIENRLEEIYSIMEWVDPAVLGRFDYFDRSFIVRDSFGGVKHYKNIPKFLDLMGEVAIRKTRHDHDVKPHMPRVVERTPLYVRLDTKSKRLYNRIVSDLLDELNEPGFTNFDLAANYGADNDASPAELARRGRIMSKMVCLRMLCDHPLLLQISAEKYRDSQAGEGIGAGSKYAYQLREEGALDWIKNDAYPTPKLDALYDEVLTHVTDGDHSGKVVVFSFFKEMLYMMEEDMQVMGLSPVLFHGEMSPKQKDAAKQIFLNDPACKVFLSSDAGGYGVDLPVANYLLSYDLPWSAGALEQRNSRIIRLSSEYDEVTVGSVLIDGSLEERQFQMLEDKRLLASAFLDGRGVDTKGELTLSLDTLKDFLHETSV